MKFRTPRRALAAAAVVLCALAAVAPAASADDHDHDHVVLSQGHTDGIDVQAEGGQLVLKVHDDTVSPSRTLDPDDVLFHVKPEAAFTVPAGLPPSYSFIGNAGDVIYLLPQVQTDNPDVVWLGWATQRLAPGTVTGNLTLEMVSVTGPGDVFLWQTDTFGGPINKWGKRAGFPTSTPLAQNAHVHSNWAFTAVGEYTIEFQVTGTAPGGAALSTGPVAYSFHVGELPEPTGTTLTVEGADATYQAGDTVTLTAVQAPVTGLDHYHWFVKPVGAPSYTIVPGEVGGTYSFTATAAHDGALVVAKLYDDDHAVVAESAPVTLDVDGPSAPDASQIITALLDDADGALLLSVDPDDREVQLTQLTLNGVADAFTASGELRPVRVVDTRAGKPGWNASGQSSDFTGSAGGTIDAAGLGWAPQVSAQSPGQGVTAGPTVAPGSGLGTSRTLATAPAGAGRGTATLGAGLDLEAPTSTEAGTYTAVLTFTAI